MDDFELELKMGFLDESAQGLTDAEQCFLSLESAADDPSIIEKIFRLAHNLKGSARAVGFSDMGEFTHNLESLLLKIKNKEIQIQQQTVDLLLRCNDFLKAWVDTLKADLNAKVDYAELLDLLKAHLNGQVPNEASSASAPEEPVTEVPSAADFSIPDSSVSEESAAIPSDLPESVPDAGAFVEEPATPAEVNAEKVEASAPPPLPITQHPTASVAAPSAPAPAAPSGHAAPPADENIRVSLRRLEQLLNNVGELVILQTVLNQQRALIPSPLLQKTVVQLAKITKDIQDISMSLRMVPLKQTFQKMQRIVRDTSKMLGKEVVLELVGEETELDKTMADQLGDPLVHLIRNAVDHGLESPDEREAIGKDRKGKVRLAAYHKGGQMVIEVKDDGKGLDANRLRQKAIEKGVLKPNATISDEEAYRLIFAAGFSTKTEVTEVSGRGVGMDVVRTNIEQVLQGEIELETKLGEGTTFRIYLPLTLAIIDGMVVQCDQHRFVVPLNHVFESLQPTEKDVQFSTGMGEVLVLRGEHLPLYRLNYALGLKSKLGPASEGIAIVVRSGKTPFAILVDDILGQQQVVIKNLGAEVGSIRGVSGGAILGDGRAALILDLVELANRQNIKLNGPVAGQPQNQLRGVA